MKTSIDWERLVVIVVALLAAAVSIVLIWMNTLKDPDALNWNSWAFYEWLINYEGGFVRRGLSGEIISMLARGQEIRAVNFLAFSLGVAYIGLSILQMLQTHVSGKEALLYIFAPTGFFSISVSNEFYYRKEMMFYCAIIGIASIFRTWNRNRSTILGQIVLVFVMFFSLLLPLIHEAFIFYCVLIFSLMSFAIVRHHHGLAHAKRLVFAYVLLNLLIFGVLSKFKGDAGQGMRIWDSLSPNIKSLSPSGEIYGGIAAIGWSTLEGIKLPLKTLLSGLGTYYAFPLIMGYLAVAFVRSRMDKVALMEICCQQKFVFNFLLVCTTFSPLFILGWDWGRWVLGIFIVFSSMAFSDLLVEVKTGRMLYLIDLARRREAIFILVILVSVFTRTPECCMDGSGNSFFNNKMKTFLVNRSGSQP